MNIMMPRIFVIVLPAIIATLLPMATSAFELVPFMQIDLQFYLRLAQCQAKCAEKFGSSSRVQLLDGHWRPSLNWSTPMTELCQMGCLDSDSPSSPRSPSDAEQSPSALAFLQGQLFFRQTSPDNPFQQIPLPATSILPPPPQIQLVRALCAERAAASSLPGGMKSTPGEKYEALMAIELAKWNDGPRQRRRPPTSAAEGPPLRFVVQWRRRPKVQQQQNSDMEEPKWTTASIESGGTFRVTGIRAGQLHQFAVRAVSPSGPQAELPALSEWLDFPALADPAGLEGITLQFFSRYNAEHGVAALVRWRRESMPSDIAREQSPKAVVHQRLRRHHQHHHRHQRSLRHFSPPPSMPLTYPQGMPSATESVQELKALSEYRTMDESMEHRLGHLSSGVAPVFPTCKLQVEWANKSTRAVDEFELDGSDGYLLRHLGFNSEYSVRLLGGTTASQPIGFGQQQKPLEGTFLSMHCSQVFGAGSLECNPEPVHRLQVATFVENGTALIRWQQPDELAHILLYEVSLEPTATSTPEAMDSQRQCEVKPSVRIVSAQSNSIVIPLPQATICEFQLRVTVYDLLGRDASAQLRFSFVPLAVTLRPQPSALSFLVRLDGSILALLAVVVFVPLAAMVTLVCTLSSNSTKKQKAVRQRLPGGNCSDQQHQQKKGKKMKQKNDEEGRRMKRGKQKMEEAGAVQQPQQQQQLQQQQQCNSPHSTGTTESTIITVAPSAGCQTSSPGAMLIGTPFGQQKQTSPGAMLVVAPSPRAMLIVTPPLGQHQTSSPPGAMFADVENGGADTTLLPEGRRHGLMRWTTEGWRRNNGRTAETIPATQQKLISTFGGADEEV